MSEEVLGWYECELQLTMALSNTADICRLYELEGRGLPLGFSLNAFCSAINYVCRIAYLSATSHGQRQPKVYLNEYVNPQTP